MAVADRLSSDTILDHHAAVSMIEKMREDHKSLGRDRCAPGRWDFRLHYGAVSARLHDSGMHIRVFADDDTNLSYVKMEIAAHAAKILGTTSGIHWSGQDNMSAPPVFFREISVVSSWRVSPHMQRIRFRADNLARYAIGGLHIRILIPPAGRKPIWPTIAPDGMLSWPRDEDTLTVRIYTIRSIDVVAGTLDVDFVLHPGLETPAASFATNAREGQVIGMLGPGGDGVPQNKSLLIAGDDTAIPAISRILENRRPESTARVFLEVDSEADVVPIGNENAAVTWLFRKGRPAGTTGLLSKALRALDPAALPLDLYVWAGCEFSDFREIRKLVRKDWNVPKDRHLVVAYWRQGANGGDRTSNDE